MRGARGVIALCALLALSAYFALAILRATGPTPPFEAVPAAGGPPPSPPPPVAFEIAEPTPLPDLREAMARPLFSEDRRPDAGPAPAPAAPTQLNAKLSGVISLGGENVALLTPGDGGAAEQVRSGDVFRGWLVAEVGEQSVTLERDGRRETLTLDFRRGAPRQ